jgi:hypothetical protein
MFRNLFGEIGNRGRGLYNRANALARAAATRALQGVLMLVFLTAILLWVFATKSDPMVRLPMGVITTLLIDIGIIWVFGGVATFVLVWGLVNGFLNNQQVAEFKNLGGFGFFRILFSGTKSGLTGALGNLWKVGQKFGQAVRWVSGVSLLCLLFPLWYVGIWLWIAPLIILTQVALHTFNHRNDRDEGWQIIHRSSLWVIACLVWLSILPELTTVLPMLWKPDLTLRGILQVLHFSFYVRLVLSILGGLFVRNAIIRPAIKNATRPTEVGSTATAATSTPTPVSGMDPHYYENNHHQPKTNYALRAIGPAFLLLMVVAVCATIIFLNIQTEGFQKIVALIHL